VREFEPGSHRFRAPSRPSPATMASRVTVLRGSRT
jgi:hypothetical protein